LPDFSGRGEAVALEFSRPLAIQGTYENKLARTREIRDLIKAKIEMWGEEVCLAACV
jgi:hypothetical protein